MAPAGLLANALSAGDKAPCRAIIRVLSLMTTVTDLGVCPVRLFSKAMAACAICCAMVALDLTILSVPSEMPDGTISCARGKLDFIILFVPFGTDDTD